MRRMLSSTRRTLLVIGGAVLALVVIFLAASNLHWGETKADGPNGSPTTTTAPGNPGAVPPSLVTGTRCPTNGEMQSIFGFDKMSPPIKPVATGDGISWEGCKWNLQWVSAGNLALPMLPGWQFTATMAEDSVVVWYGDGKSRPVKGATIRYLPAYNTSANKWVWDGCELLKRENNYSQGKNPAYDTTSGNVCSNGTSVSPLTVAGITSIPTAPAGATAAATTAAPAAITAVPASKCPTSATDAANLLSGGKDTWKDNGVDGSGVHKWIFTATSGNADLKYPGYGSFDHWKFGAGYKQDIPGADGATFNCS